MKLFSTTANPVPAGAVCGSVKTADGVMLRYARWLPNTARRGTVCVFPGRTEKIEKYFETVEDLRARGFAVAVLDWRGQGGSQRLLRDPMKGHVPDFANHQLDLQAFVRDVMLPDCPPPYFALAHSMGAAVLLDTARIGRRWFDRMVLVAPMLEIALLRHPKAARRTASLLCAFGLAGVYAPGARGAHSTDRPFEGNKLSSDPVRYERNRQISREHPELDVGAPTIGWVKAAFDLMDRLAEPATARAIRQPLLMIAAGADQVVSTPAIEHLGTRLIAGSHIVVPGARHELLQERDAYRGQLFAAFDAFIPGSRAF